MHCKRNIRVIIALSGGLALIIVGLALVLGKNVGTKPEPSAALSGDTQEYDLDKLHSYRTPYVGDNSKVAAIAQLLPAPDSNMRYDRISIQTDRKPFGLTIYYVPTKKITEYPMDEHGNPNSDYNKRQNKNFVVLFSLIDNLGSISFNTDFTSIDNGQGIVTVPRSNFENWVSDDLWADNYKKLIEVFGVIDKDPLISNNLKENV